MLSTLSNLFRISGRKSEPATEKRPQKLENGFYQNFLGVRPEQLEFVCYGLPRSGSTLVFQLIAGIYPEGVAKTHGYCRHPVKTAVTYRDFRDIVVSSWRAKDPANAGRRMTLDEVERSARWCKGQIALLDKYCARADACVLQYEKFANAPLTIFSAVEQKFGVKVPKEQAEELVEKYSLEENKRISDKLGRFKAYDKKTLIHGNHIYNGAVGGWSGFVDEQGASLLEKILGPYLRRYGYSS
jgi:hypothetical protein